MKHDTIEDLKENLLDEIENIKKVNQLHGKINKQINENDLKKAIIKSCDIIHIDYSVEQDMSNYTYAIYNPRTMNYIRSTVFLQELIEYIISSQDVSPNITTKKAANIIDTAIMSERNKIRKANLPPTYLVKFKNCIINLKTKETFEFNDSEIKDYDFIETLRYNLKDINDVNKSMLDIVKTVFDLWSQNDNDVRLTIMQLFFSFIEGNGKNKYIILQSEGGDGKTACMRMIQKIGNPELTNYINLNDLTNDNILNQVQPSTRFFFGDDLVSNFKMSSKDLARFKTLVDGGSISVSEKYMPNKLISCRGLKIQATNTEVKFYENNDAIKSRVIYIKWPHYDFRENPIEDFNLDQLSGKYGKANTGFMEALIAYIIENVEYFNKFNVTNKMKNDFEDILDTNDTIKMYVDELEENELLESKYLPYNVLYEDYKRWLNINNPGSKPVKSTEYIKRISPILENKNFSKLKSPKRIRTLTKNEFDINNFEGIYIDESKQTKVFINNNHNIDLETFTNDLQNLTINKLLEKYNKSNIIAYINNLKSSDPTLLFDLSSKLNIKVNELIDHDKEELLIELKNLIISENID